MKYNFHYENFRNIYEFEKALNQRATNMSFLENESSRRTDREEWRGTKTYEEADSLLKKGWNVNIEEMKNELSAFSKSCEVQKRKVIKSVAGFAPCVPNAIRGCPKSMFATKSAKQKMNKCIHLIVNNNATASVSGSELLRSGLTILKLIMLIEKQHIKTKLDVIPNLAILDNLCYGCSVTIKDYKQPFNLSKMAYPLAHVSFSRRHGFHYHETSNVSDEKTWVKNYGYPFYTANMAMREAFFKYAGFQKDGTVYIDFKDCQNADFDPFKLAKWKNIELN